MCPVGLKRAILEVIWEDYIKYPLKNALVFTLVILAGATLVLLFSALYIILARLLYACFGMSI